MEDQPRNSVLGCCVRGPREEHVGDEGVRAEFLYEIFKRLLEQGKGVEEFAVEFLVGDCIQILKAIGEANLFCREFDEFEGDFGGGVLGFLDGFGKERGVERGGDYGGPDASGCKEPDHVQGW